MLNLFVINDNDFSSTATQIDAPVRGARSHVATEAVQVFDRLRKIVSSQHGYEGRSVVDNCGEKPRFAVVSETFFFALAIEWILLARREPHLSCFRRLISIMRRHVRKPIK